MGKSTTLKYRVEVLTPTAKGNSSKTIMPWEVKDRGAANDENLESWVYRFGKSFEVGGVNAHLSELKGFIPYPTYAEIINQQTGEVVASWKAGMFQVW